MKNGVTVEPELIHFVNEIVAKKTWPKHHDKPQSGVTADHFVERDGIQFAGTHLILGFWGGKKLDNLQLMENSLRDCVSNCGATLLHIHLHHFTPNGGISGVAVLAESHISVHTWPERDFAAFDIVMCGDAQPEEAIAILMRAFTPNKINITENLRGGRWPCLNFQKRCMTPYVGGIMAFAWGTDNRSLRRTEAQTLASRYMTSKIKTRYDNPDLHHAAFALPQYLIIDSETVPRQMIN